MTHVLFDFDGTLADSLSAIVAITNRLAPEFGYRPTPPEAIETLKGLTAGQLIRRSGLPWLKIPALLRRVRAELRQQTAQIPPCPGMPQVIRTLHQQQHSLAVVTSNTPEVVQAFLATHQLQSYFLSVEGGGTLFRKQRLIRRCLQQHQWLPTQTVYVGDEVRDVDAARAAGIRAIAVTWGFNSREALVRAQPDWLVEDPQQLLAIAAEASADH